MSIFRTSHLKWSAVFVVCLLTLGCTFDDIKSPLTESEIQKRLFFLQDKYNVRLSVNPDYHDNITSDDFDVLESILRKESVQKHTLSPLTKAIPDGYISYLDLKCKKGTKEFYGSNGKVNEARYEFVLRTMVYDEITLAGDINIDGTEAEVKDLFGFDGSNDKQPKLVLEYDPETLKTYGTDIISTSIDLYVRKRILGFIQDKYRGTYDVFDGSECICFDCHPE